MALALAARLRVHGFKPELELAWTAECILFAHCAAMVQLPFGAYRIKSGGRASKAAAAMSGGSQIAWDATLHMVHSGFYRLQRLHPNLLRV